MPRRSPQQATERWVRKMGAATQDFTDGINAVTTAPGQAAARNVSGYQNGVQAAITNGKWARNVSAVSLEDWKQAAITKGAARLASGAAAAAPKVQAAQERIGRMVDTAKAAIQQMPRDTPEARIARSQAFLTHMRRLGQQQR